MVYDERNYEAIKFLDPIVADKVKQLLGRLEAIGEDILIVSGNRTSVEQDQLFKKVPRVTHDDDSNSSHTWGLAIDVVPVTYFGLQWKDGKRYAAIAREAMQLEFEWGWQMWGFDKPHFQYTQGLTISDLKRGAHLGTPVAPYNERKPNLGIQPSEIRLRSLHRGIRRSTGVVRLLLQRQLVRLLKRIS